MSKDTRSDKTEQRERLALLGLAADRQDSREGCPEDQDFAEFLEADPSSPQQQRFINHLAVCDSCRQKWLVLSEELGASGAEKPPSSERLGRRTKLSLIGSACAVVAGVMLYLSIDYRTVQYEVVDSPVSESMAPAPTVKDRYRMAKPDSDAELKKETVAEMESAADPSQPAQGVAASHQDAREQQTLEQPGAPVPIPAEAPMKLSKSKRISTLSDDEGTSIGAGAMEYAAKAPHSFEDFLNSFTTFCADRKKLVSGNESIRTIVAQAKALLDEQQSLAAAHQEFLVHTMRLLTGSEPGKDTELDQLCKDAVELATELEKETVD